MYSYMCTYMYMHVYTYIFPHTLCKNYVPSDKRFIFTEMNEDLKETTLPVLKVEMDELFSGRTILHNKSSRTKYLQILIFAGLLDQTQHVRSEAGLHHKLLTLFLLWVFHFAQVTTVPTAFEGERFSKAVWNSK